MTTNFTEKNVIFCSRETAKNGLQPTYRICFKNQKQKKYDGNIIHAAIQAYTRWHVLKKCELQKPIKHQNLN